MTRWLLPLLAIGLAAVIACGDGDELPESDCVDIARGGVHGDHDAGRDAGPVVPLPPAAPFR